MDNTPHKEKKAPHPVRRRFLHGLVFVGLFLLLYFGLGIQFRAGGTAGPVSGQGGVRFIGKWISPVLSVALTADPPVVMSGSSAALAATVPGSTGFTINYSFWWNCTDPTNNVSVAVSMCGALPDPIPGNCVSNAAGAKCDSIDATTQSLNHIYGTVGSYTSKVIVERGFLIPAQSQVNVQVTATGGGPLTIPSCYASQNAVKAGGLVTWAAFPQGGTGSYTFLWAGDVPLGGNTGNPVNVVYDTLVPSSKAGSISVTSGASSVSKPCGTVAVSPGIISLTDDKASLKLGDSSTLSWSSVGFTSCTLDSGSGPQPVPTDCNSSSTCPDSIVKVAPTHTTTYTLVCTASGGATDTKTITVRVFSWPNFIEIKPQ